MMIVPMFGVFAAVAACSGQAVTDGSGTSNTPVTAQAKDHGGPRMGPGGGMLLFAALHEDINLTDAQRTTIQGLADGLRPKGPPPGFEENKKALAAAVRAGKVDVNALQPAKPDFAAHNAEVAKALTTLHATLTPEQRVALVAAVKKHGEDHKDGPWAHKGGPKGDGEKGEKGDGPKGMKMHEGPGHFGPMGMMKDLDLTKDQETAIKAEFDKNKPTPPTDAERETMKKNHEAMRTEMAARLDKFATPTFDATAFLAPPTNAPAPMGGGFGHGDHMLKTLSAVVPLLTPAQREKLAAKIEQGPAAK
jgi:Spy/CpxP family protein refolding chaperone